jgi:hypothetical protein
MPQQVGGALRLLDVAQRPLRQHASRTRLGGARWCSRGAAGAAPHPRPRTAGPQQRAAPAPRTRRPTARHLTAAARLPRLSRAPASGQRPAVLADAGKLRSVGGSAVPLLRASMGGRLRAAAAQGWLCGGLIATWRRLDGAGSLAARPSPAWQPLARGDGCGAGRQAVWASPLLEQDELQRGADIGGRSVAPQRRAGERNRAPNQPNHRSAPRRPLPDRPAPATTAVARRTHIIACASPAAQPPPASSMQLARGLGRLCRLPRAQLAPCSIPSARGCGLGPLPAQRPCSSGHRRPGLCRAADAALEAGSEQQASIYDNPQMYDDAFSYRDFAAECAFLQQLYQHHAGQSLKTLLELGWAAAGARRGARPPAGSAAARRSTQQGAAPAAQQRQLARQGPHASPARRVAAIARPHPPAAAAGAARAATRRSWRARACL